MTAPGHVLVVDDVEAHRYVVASVLRRAGFEVVEAATGREALEKVRPELDAVVLDVNLPDLSGIEVCAAIKRDRRTSLVPVMHVSSTAVDISSRARGLDNGADAYLVEPVEPEELVATLRSLVRSHELRRKTDRMTRRFARLSAVTLPLNSADTLLQVLEAAVAGAADVFGEPAIASAALEDGRVGRALCTGPGTVPAVEVSSEPLRPFWTAATTVATEELPEVWRRALERQPVAASRWRATSLSDRQGRISGGLAVALPVEADRLSTVDRELFDQLGAAIRVALANRLAYSAEHRLALTLQRAMLPETLPAVGGLSFDAHYLASNDALNVGGDFYDVFELPSGELAVVIGDVQGHSFRAATIMAELRFSLRAYLHEGHDPSSALDRLNALLQHHYPDDTATVGLLVFDPSRAKMLRTVAGHLPPLLLTSGGGEYLRGGGPPLGIPGAAFPSIEVELPAQCAVVLVTDGLIERRDERIDESLGAMRSALLAAQDLDPEKIVDTLLDRFSPAAPDDDIAVLVVGRDQRGSR